MPKTLRVLLVEDSEDDVQLLLRALERGGYDPVWRRVDTAEAMSAALDEGSWNLVLCDFAMPRFGAPAALNLVQQAEGDLPFIVVSGTIGEEQAVALMKAGAHDYVLKDKLARFIPAIERELREAEARRQHKQAEAELRREQEFSKRLITSSVDGILAFDRDCRYTVWNPAMERLSGVSAADALGECAFDLFPFLKETGEDKYFFEALAGNSVIAEDRRFSIPQTGQEGWFAGSYSPLLNQSGDVEGGLAIIRDITERKKIDTRLHESETRLRNAQRVAGMGDWVWNIVTGDLRWSDEIYRIFGLAPQEFGATYEAFLASVHPDDREFVQERVNAAVYDNEEYSIDHRIVLPSGETRWVHEQGEVTRDADGAPSAMIGTVLEITARKLAEDELSRARDELEHLLAASPTVTYRIQAAGEFSATYISANVKTQLGYDPEEYLADPSFWRSRLHPDDRERILAGLSLVFERGNHTDEYRFLHKDGTYRWMRDELRVLRDPDDEPIELIGSWVDITEAKRLESQFLQAQKMEAVGQLTGGVAHDFNNLLTAVLGYSELALEKLDAEDPVRDHIDEVRKAGERAAQLTRQLLAFSRQQILEPKVMDLNAVVAGFEELLRRTIGEDVVFATALDADLGRTMVDPAQIEQVLLNLALNSRDAMPDGGRLTIETANVELDEDYARSHPPAQPGPHIMLAISDSGCGMDEETRSRIFEPFFTTKAKGEGTGLGLSTAYGIVKQSGGYIWVYSEPGQGTTFKIYLPRVEEAADVEPRTEAPAEPEGGSETILLVEDEELVRKIATRILEEKGYRIFVAEDPEEALLIVEKHGDSIDLVVTDVVMPGGTGVELMEQVAARSPGMKALFISGYADRAIFRNGHLGSDMHFLGKPFRVEALTRKVREVLDLD